MSFTAYMSRGGSTHEERLQSIIKSGRSKAIQVIEHVQNQRIDDKLAKACAMRFAPTEHEIVWKIEGEVAVPSQERGTDIMLSNPMFGLHPNAVGQIAQHAGVPADYVRKMSVSPEDWQRELISEVLTQHFSHCEEDKRLLMRCVGQKVFGAMSDRYKILRSEPLVEMFAKAAQEHDAIPSGGYLSDVRMGLRALHPEPFYISPNDALCLGIQLRISDFGRGTVSVSVFVFRSTCMNTAVMKNALSLRHLGRKMAENMALSERTIQLNTAAAASEIIDVVDQALAPECRETIKLNLQKANSKEVEYENYKDRVEKAIGKGLAAKVEEAFGSEDVVNMPEGKTLWRLSNALSWVAHEVEGDDADKAVDMERLAGALLPGG